MIQGGEDIQTPTSLARDWFKAGGSHNAILAMPEAFHAALREHVRPWAR